MSDDIDADPLRASSLGGGRFNNNDVHDHLIRMERQFAEIEAQHQQFIAGKYPDRDNLAKNLGSRYLNGPHCASMESLSGTSEVSQRRSARSRTTSDNSLPGPPQWESLHHLPGDSPEGLGTHQKPGRASSARGHGNKSGTGAAVRGFTREGQPSALKRSQSSTHTDSNADQSSNLHTKAAMAGSSSATLVSPIGRVASDSPYSNDSTVMSSSHECSPSLLIRPPHSASNTSTVSSPATSQLQSRSRPISLAATPGRPISLAATPGRSSLVTTTPGSSDYSSDKSGHRHTAGWSSGGSGSRGRVSNSTPHVFRFRDDSPEAESVASSAVGEAQSVSISMPMRQVPKDRADVIGEVNSTPSITGLCCLGASSAELMSSRSQDKLPDSYSNQSLRSPKRQAHLASHPLLSDSSEADYDGAAVQQQVDVEAHDMMHLRLDHGVKDGATSHGGVQTEGWEDEDMGEEPSLMHLHKTSKEFSSAVIKAAPKLLPLGQKHGSDGTASPSSHGGANAVAQYLVPPAAFQQQVPPAQAAITTSSSTLSASHHHQADAHHAPSAGATAPSAGATAPSAGATAPSAGATATTTTGGDSVLYGSPQVFRSDGSGSRYFLSPAGSNPRSRTAWGTQGQASAYANQAELEVVVGPGSQGSQYEQQFVILPSVGMSSAAEQVYNRVSDDDQRGLRTSHFVVPFSAGPAAYFPEATSLLYSPLRYFGDSDDEDYSISHGSSSGLHTSPSTSAAAHHHRHHISRRVSAAASTISPSPSTALAPYHLTRGGLEAVESTNTAYSSVDYTSIERYGISTQDDVLLPAGPGSAMTCSSNQMIIMPMAQEVAAASSANKVVVALAANVNKLSQQAAAFNLGLRPRDHQQEHDLPHSSHIHHHHHHYYQPGIQSSLLQDDTSTHPLAGTQLSVLERSEGAAAIPLTNSTAAMTILSTISGKSTMTDIRGEARAEWLQHEGLADHQVSPFSPHPSSAVAPSSSFMVSSSTSSASRHQQQQQSAQQQAEGIAESPSAAAGPSNYDTCHEATQQLPNNTFHSSYDDDITFHPHDKPSPTSVKSEGKTNKAASGSSSEGGVILRLPAAAAAAAAATAAGFPTMTCSTACSTPSAASDTDDKNQESYEVQRSYQKQASARTQQEEHDITRVNEVLIQEAVAVSVGTTQPALDAIEMYKTSVGTTQPALDAIEMYKTSSRPLHNIISSKDQVGQQLSTTSGTKLVTTTSPCFHQDDLFDEDSSAPLRGSPEGLVIDDEGCWPYSARPPSTATLLGPSQLSMSGQGAEACGVSHLNSIPAIIVDTSSSGGTTVLQSRTREAHHDTGHHIVSEGGQQSVALPSKEDHLHTSLTRPHPTNKAEGTLARLHKLKEIRQQQQQHLNHRQQQQQQHLNHRQQQDSTIMRTATEISSHIALQRHDDNYSTSTAATTLVAGSLSGTHEAMESLILIPEAKTPPSAATVTAMTAGSNERSTKGWDERSTKGWESQPRRSISPHKITKGRRNSTERRSPQRYSAASSAELLMCDTGSPSGRPSSIDTSPSRPSSSIAARRTSQSMDESTTVNFSSSSFVNTLTTAAVENTAFFRTAAAAAPLTGSSSYNAAAAPLTGSSSYNAAAAPLTGSSSYEGTQLQLLPSGDLGHGAMGMSADFANMMVQMRAAGVAALTPVNSEGAAGRSIVYDTSTPPSGGVGWSPDLQRHSARESSPDAAAASYTSTSMSLQAGSVTSKWESPVGRQQARVPADTLAAGNTASPALSTGSSCMAWGSPVPEFIKNPLVTSSPEAVSLHPHSYLHANQAARDVLCPANRVMEGSSDITILGVTTREHQVRGRRRSEDQAIIVVGPSSGSPSRSVGRQSFSPNSRQRSRAGSHHQYQQHATSSRGTSSSAGSPPLPPAASTPNRPALSSALTRLKNQRMLSALRQSRQQQQRQQVHTSALPLSVASASGRLASSEVQFEGVRAEDVSLRKTIRGPLKSEEAAKQAPTFTEGVTAGAAKQAPTFTEGVTAGAFSRMDTARQQQLEHNGGAAVASVFSSSSKPYLRRRSQKVSSKKLDWSYVKPRTVTRTKDNDSDYGYLVEGGRAKRYTGEEERAYNQDQQGLLHDVNHHNNARNAQPPSFRNQSGHSEDSRDSGASIAWGVQLAHVNSGDGTGARLGAARRSMAAWRPGGKLPPSPSKAAADGGTAGIRRNYGVVESSLGRDGHSRDQGAGWIPGLDYEVQRHTSTYHPSGNYHLASPAPGMHHGHAMTSGATRKVVKSAHQTSSRSPLDDLLSHVNTLLKDFDTMMVQK